MSKNSPIAVGESVELPLLPLRDVVVYPHMVIPLFVGREKSINALESAMAADKKILLVAQKNADIDDPEPTDLFPVGTLATILQLLKLPDGTIKVLVEGAGRANWEVKEDLDDYVVVTAKKLEEPSLDARQTEVVSRSLMSQFEQYVKLNKKIPQEILSSLASIDDPGRAGDTIAAHMNLKIEDKQQVLELTDVAQRLEKLISLLDAEIDLMQMEKRIRGRVKKQMEKSQREYYLNEQIKAIQKELGDMEDGAGELEELADKIEKAGMPKEAYEKVTAELSKLKMMSPVSAEATVVRSYIDAMIGVPWKKRSRVRNDLCIAEQILEADHYGLEKVKERILEYLAVQGRVRKLKGPILCLVGPPGVGKTSLGQSIARATQRKYVRMALGGVRDEAEIRGHRRTYIGSMPGKIIQKLTKVGVKNPLFLLDEIDKMGMDHRGDPASALLEVLDPEQNNTFNDHYLEVDYDLSDVMFIATANSMNIPGPLLDRMEVIRLPGYTEDEKANIALKYLLPKQIKDNGLKADEVEVAPQVITDIVRFYTREAGVRGLDRELSKICRKVVRQLSLKQIEAPVKIETDQLEDYLGVKKFRFGLAEEEDQIGQVTGLAWTEVGGELLTIESVVVPGKGKVVTTGQLGSVMQESIQAALSVVRSRAEALGYDADFYEKNDIHVHVPEGATPKDGPSAGIGMCTALVSTLSKIPVKSSVAMTGEITLRGEVLPIGGLKEKLLAARRGGITDVIIPEENVRDLSEIPENIKGKLNIHPVKWIDQVLEIALARKAGEAEGKKALKKAPKKSDLKKNGDRVSHH